MEDNLDMNFHWRIVPLLLLPIFLCSLVYAMEGGFDAGLPPPPPLTGDADGLPLPPPPPMDPLEGGLPLPPPPSADDLPPPPGSGDELFPTVTPDRALPPAPTPPPVPTPGMLGGDITGIRVDTIPAGGIPGKIVGGRVNIRAGASSDQFDIIDTLSEGTNVVVYGAEGDWTAIGYPENQYCYVHQRHIQGDIPANIPEQGIVRSLQGGPIHIRIKPWVSERNIVGEGTEGDTVIVLDLRGQWARIRAPAHIRAWVFSRYVDYEGKPDRDAVAREPSSTPGAERASTDRSLIQSQRDREIAQRQREEFLRQQQRQREMRDRKKSIFSDLEEQLAEIERQKEARLRQAAVDSIEDERLHREARERVHLEATPPPPPGALDGYSGWIERIPRMGGRPTEFRLVKGNDVLFLLHSNVYDLSLYRGKQVLVNGVVRTAPSWEANIMEVTYLRLFNQMHPEPATLRPVLPDARFRREVRSTSPVPDNLRRSSDVSNRGSFDNSFLPAP